MAWMQKWYAKYPMAVIVGYVACMIYPASEFMLWLSELLK